MTQYQTLSELMDEDRERRIAEARAEIAAEKAAWDAMTPEEQKAVHDAREAKYAALEDAPDDPDICDACGEPDCDFDCDGDYDG